jgi:hypothetical protein
VILILPTVGQFFHPASDFYHPADDFFIPRARARAHYHLDSKNIAERERPELSQAIDGSCDRGHYGEGATKHISDININSSNSFQRGGLTLLLETIELQNDTISGNQDRRLSSERYCSFSSPIPERILQESSSCCISEPTRYHHSTNIVQGSNVGEAKILQYPYPEAIKLHNKEGHSGFSTISGRDGYTVNQIEVVHKVHQKCENCDKTILYVRQALFLRLRQRTLALDFWINYSFLPSMWRLKFTSSVTRIHEK